MKSSVWAKIGGWAAFGFSALAAFAQQQAASPIHGWAGWLVAIAGLAGAVGIHASSNTDGTK